MTSLERHFFRTALTLWGIFAAVLVTLLMVRSNRSLIPLYIDATNQFWAGVLPSTNYLTGYYYLPASQILFTPIWLLGVPVGGAVTQLTYWALLTWAIWELARLMVPERARIAFALMLVLCIPGVASILRVAQFDAPMWALTALAAVAIARERPWLAAVALALALAIKPTAIVACLLMGAVWPKVGVRLVPLVLAVLLAPFLVAERGYVTALYLSLADRIGGAIQTPRDWHDIGNMLLLFGMRVPFELMLGIRAAAALATLGIVWLARRRLPLPQAAFLAFAFAGMYLLLFNPRTESGGYAGLSIIAATLAARMLLVEGRRWAAAMLMAVCLLMGVPGLTRFTIRLLGVWLKPSLGILVTGLVLIPRALVPRLWRPAQDTTEPARPAPR